MKVSAQHKNEMQTVYFEWNEELTEVKYFTIGVPEEQVKELVDTLVAEQVYEGKDWGDWVTSID